MEKEEEDRDESGWVGVSNSIYWEIGLIVLSIHLLLDIDTDLIHVERLVSLLYKGNPAVCSQQ